MLAGHLPEKVYARGSGKVRKELEETYGCPYAFEAAFITLQDSDITIEMERFLYGVARSYSECFRVYGENKSFEWQQLADEDPVLYTRTGELQRVDILNEEKEESSRGGEILEERIKIPDYADVYKRQSMINTLFFIPFPFCRRNVPENLFFLEPLSIFQIPLLPVP